MNKTVNINLGGIFFHIDEDAYLKLKKYLDAIRRSLSDDPQGKDEILADIESRIGELLLENRKTERQVINEKDIKAVITRMGKPEDYAGDEEIFNEELHSEKQKNKSAYTRKRRLFRDGEDKFLGGVSSGLAHYFDVDVTVVRMLWLVSVFVFGTGFLAYLILWIILPEAKTTSEKLQMQGDPVTVSNIEKKIKEEFGDVSDRIKEGYDSLKTKDYSHVKSGLQDVIDSIGKALTILFSLVGKLVGVLLVIIGFTSLLSLFFGSFSIGALNFKNVDIYDLPPFLYASSIPTWLLTIMLFLAIGIPLLFLLFLGLRILSNGTTRFGKTTKAALLGVWLIALLGLVFAGIEFGTRFHAVKTIVNSEQALNIKPKDTLIIQMKSRKDFEYRRNYGTKIVLDNGVEKVYNTNVDIDIREVKMGEKAHISVFKHASGSSLKNAKMVASAIEYNYELKENLLTFNDYLLANIKQRYQGQNIDVVIYISQGTSVYLDESTKHYLDDVDNVQNIYDRNMINHYFTMTPQGFDCTDCLSDEINKEKNNKGSFKLKMDENGIDLKVKTKENDSTAITLDGNGLQVK